MSINPQHRTICDFDGALVTIWAEVSKDGVKWQQWRPAEISTAEEQPKNGTALRALVRSYSRTITSAIATLPYEVSWVRVMSRDSLTRRILSTTTTQWDFIAREFSRVESQCWIICDRSGDCERWRLERITRKLEALTLPRTPKTTKADLISGRFRKGVVVASVLGALLCGTVGYAIKGTSAVRRPAVAAPSPSTRTVDVIRVELPDGKSVTVPVSAHKDVTNRMISQVIREAVQQAARKGKGSPAPSASPAPSTSPTSGRSATKSPDKGRGKESAKPSPSAKDSDDSAPETAPKSEPKTAPEKTEPEKAPGILMAAPLSVALDAVLPLPSADSAPRLLAAAPMSLSLFSAHLSSVGTVTDQVSVQSGDTVALAATVDVPGADAVSVAVAATPEKGNDVTVSAAAVPSDADDSDVAPKVITESATKEGAPGTALGVGLSAVAAAVVDAPPADAPPADASATPAE